MNYNWVYILIAIYVLLLICQIIKVFSHRWNTLVLFDIFEELGKELKNNQYSFSNPIGASIIQKRLIPRIPKIRSVLPHLPISFHSSDGLIETYDFFNNIKGYVEEEYYETNNFILKAFNLIRPLKSLFLLPSKILSWFGLNMNMIPARIFSLITYAFLAVVEKYGLDIFDWFIKLIS